MPDETSRRYLFMAIDRATRWIFAHIYGDMTNGQRRLFAASEAGSAYHHFQDADG